MIQPIDSIDRFIHSFIQLLPLTHFIHSKPDHNSFIHSFIQNPITTHSFIHSFKTRSQFIHSFIHSIPYLGQNLRFDSASFSQSQQMPVHLRRQLQRRRQNHRADVLRCTSVSTIHLRAVRVQTLKDREQIRRRFTGTCRGNAQ